MLNTIIVEGRITKDVELKTTKNNQTVVLFNIANTDAKDNAVFLPCEAWGKTAEHIAKYFKKGDGIEIVGRLTIRKYTSKEGEEKERASIVVDVVHFPLGKKQEPKNDEVDDSDCPY